MTPKPRTEKQKAASRANGAKSKGPVTAKGKSHSSKNATRHGLLAQALVLDGENEQRFLQILNQLVEENNPQTLTERILVENMAIAHWQHRRTIQMQKEAMRHEIAHMDPDAANSAACATKALKILPADLLLRYATAAERQFNRSLARLEKTQDRRQAHQSERTWESIETEQPEVQSGPKHPPHPTAPKRPSIPPAAPCLGNTHQSRGDGTRGVVATMNEGVHV